MDKFGNKFSKESSQDFSTLSRRIANLKEKLASLGPETYDGVKAKLESIEKILGLNDESKDFPYLRVKEVVKQMPNIGEKINFLEKTLRLSEKEGEAGGKNEKNFSYLRIKDCVTEKIPKIGEKIDFLETTLGLSEEAGDKNKKDLSYLRMREYVTENLPKLGEKIDFLESMLGLS